MRLFLLLLSSIILLSCGSAPYNPTVFPYEIDAKTVKNPNFKRLLIAPINIGKPSRLYLQKRELYIDGKIKTYLQKHGYVVISNRIFTSRWKDALYKYGEVYDPTTGKFTKAFEPALAETLHNIFADSNIDGVVFTDIVETSVQYTGGINHIARWHGVQRKPVLQGPGDGVSVDFDWSAQVDAASLWVNIYNKDLNRVFSGAGGIEVLDAIDTKGREPGFSKRRKILENDTQIMEGIKLAFHPFIEWKKYPKSER